MRTSTFLAATLVAAGLATAPPASAAGETCQGEAATLVGSYRQVGLVGTDGRDVVVTNGASEVMTLGGDDLVCVTGSEGRYPLVGLDTGAGDDVVDAGAYGGPVIAVLGAGRDDYTGSVGASDRVVAGAYDAEGIHVDAEDDTIRTGPEGGSDDVRSGTPGLPNGDVVVVEAHRSRVNWSGTMTATGRLDATAGPRSELRTELGTRDAKIDATAGTLVRDGFVTLRWSGFDDFAFGGNEAPSALRFEGSRRDETIKVYFPLEAGKRQRWYLGGGDDTLISRDGAGGSKSRYNGGPGHDVVDVWAGDRLRLDLATGRMVMREGGREINARYAKVESSRLGANSLLVRGTKRADDIRFLACTATVRGRAGDDVITAARSDSGHLLDCRPDRSSYRVHGDAGNDTLRGSRGKDLLVGGPGRDRVNGKANRDRCSGERVRNCEVRLR